MLSAIKNFIVKKSKLAQAWVANYNYRQAVKLANVLVAKTGKKHLVMLHNGKFVVIEQSRLKQLHREGKFKKGVNMRHVKQSALFTTNL